MNEPSPIQMMLLMQDPAYRERIERHKAEARKIIELLTIERTKNPLPTLRTRPSIDDHTLG